MRYKVVKRIVIMFETYVVRAVRNLLNLLRHDLPALDIGLPRGAWT